MIKYSKLLNILLAALIVLGSVSGIYATTITQDNHNHSIGKTIYVAKNGTDRNDGLTPTHPKRNIKSAIDSAQSGDTIKVAPGTYTENIIIDKNLTLTGNNQENTIIDGNHIANCVRVYGGATVKIAGFTIKNGVQGDTYDFGGGIYNYGGVLTVENSTITDNTAGYSGGIYNFGTLNLHNVTIKNNRAQDSGGGISNDGGTVIMEDSTVTDNTATDLEGGGIYNRGTITIKRSTIQKNHSLCSGGISNLGILTVEDSMITENTAGASGGGISNYNLLYLYGTTITNNRAGDGGGLMNTYQAYVDDLTVGLMGGNIPNNFGGTPYIPA